MVLKFRVFIENQKFKDNGENWKHFKISKFHTSRSKLVENNLDFFFMIVLPIPTTCYDPNVFEAFREFVRFWILKIGSCSLCCVYYTDVGGSHGLL